MKVNLRRTDVSAEQKRNLLVDLMDQDASGVRLCRLSLAQRRLWFLEQLEPGIAAHNISSGLRLSGRLDIQALRRAVARIVERHETLRTSFVTSRGEVFQKICPTADVEIPALDLRAVPDDIRDRKAYQIASEEACRPFDLEAARFSD